MPLAAARHRRIGLLLLVRTGLINAMCPCDASIVVANAIRLDIVFDELRSEWRW